MHEIMIRRSVTFLLIANLTSSCFLMDGCANVNHKNFIKCTKEHPEGVEICKKIRREKPDKNFFGCVEIDFEKEYENYYSK